MKETAIAVALSFRGSRVRRDVLVPTLTPWACGIADCSAHLIESSLSELQARNLQTINRSAAVNLLVCDGANVDECYGAPPFGWLLCDSVVRNGCAPSKYGILLACLGMRRMLGR